ncbi:MAG: hypothetical protein MJ169_01815 [Treponema sp.]|nr:hypothetical protein [Treponema sp.]
MADINFSQKVIAAVDKRTEYYNREIMPKLLEQYRLMHSCVKILFDTLVEKSLIKPDPYKLEKKISDIVSPSSDPFTDNERTLAIGSRFSDYEAMLDFITNYYKMSIDSMTIPQIKKFVDFNNAFTWTSFSENSTRPNTRGLAYLVMEAKRNMPPMAANQLQDTINKLSKATNDITAILKDISEYQKEVYKAYVRKDIFDHPKYDRAKAAESPAEEMAQIKKIFPAVMGKKPFYTALIEEITKEDFGPNRDQIQQALLSKLEVHEAVERKKVVKVDPKDELMRAVQALSALGPQLEVVHQKLLSNHQVLQNENNTFMAKFAAALRKAFNIKEPPVEYTILIVDKDTSTSHKEKIIFQTFVNDIGKKAVFFNSFALKASPTYQKIEAYPADKILEFINKYISESQKMFTLLGALDEFFKNAPQPENRKNIKGLKMELTTMKNSIVNTNQHRGEYLSFIEEQIQMQKLGINING